MKSLAILLFMMVIRYSSSTHYIRTYSDCVNVEGGVTFDGHNCFSTNKTMLDLLEATAAQMDRLVGYLEKDGTVPNNVLDDYKAAITLERKTARKFIPDWVHSKDPNAKWCSPETSVIQDYAMLLIWDAKGSKMALEEHFRRTPDHHLKFFTTPSATLDKYYAMKQKESDTWQNFYYHGGEDIYDKPTENPFGGETAEAGFECPKKKRESGSAVASKLNAQVLVIFLCMVIGIFVVDLQPWFENGEDELRSKERALVRVQRYLPREEGFLLGSVEVEVDCKLQSREE